jgi:hypothetical protein
MELIPYTETRRDQLEQELAAMANKKEINERHNNGIQVIAYWLVAENVTTIWVHDERTNSAVEFEVDPAEVLEWFQHPFAHPDANLPRYEQGENND